MYGGSRVAWIQFATADCSVGLSSTYSARTRAQIYTLDMLMQGLGYPLYMPAPSSHLPVAYRTHGIRVGDVGAVTANGAFDFMFNICRHDDQLDVMASDPAELPDGFELLTPVVRVDEPFGPCTTLPGNHVNESCQGL